jgi:hypothetical protein
MSDEKMPPELAVRLLRAKAGELETFAKRRLTDLDYDDHRQPQAITEIGYIAADVALIAGLLADFMEQMKVVKSDG